MRDSSGKRRWMGVLDQRGFGESILRGLMTVRRVATRQDSDALGL